MNAECTSRELARAGYAVHERDGIWWHQIAPGFCRPVDLLGAISPGTVRPRWSKSYLGYSHVVPPGCQGNRPWAVMLLDSAKLKAFEINCLKPKRRSIIRKALRELEVRRMSDVDEVVNDMNAICVSFAERTGYGKPPSYYTQRRSQWETLLRHQFEMGSREHWGAFSSGRLIAYYVGVFTENTAYIGSARSHTDFLGLCPNDVLTFRFIEHCRECPGCDQVMFGDWTDDVPSLNAFKEQYGFVKTLMPVYRCERPLFAAVAALRPLKRCVEGVLAKRMSRFTGTRTPDVPAA